MIVPSPLTKNKMITVIDMIGHHPVEVIYDRKGSLLYRNDILSALKGLKEHVHEYSKRMKLLPFQIEDYQNIIDYHFPICVPDDVDTSPTNGVVEHSESTQEQSQSPIGCIAGSIAKNQVSCTEAVKSNESGEPLSTGCQEQTGNSISKDIIKERIKAEYRKYGGHTDVFDFAEIAARKIYGDIIKNSLLQPSNNRKVVDKDLTNSGESEGLIQHGVPAGKFDEAVTSPSDSTSVKYAPGNRMKHIKPLCKCGHNKSAHNNYYDHCDRESCPCMEYEPKKVNEK